MAGISWTSKVFEPGDSVKITAVFGRIKDSISGRIEKKQTVVSQQYDHSEFGEIEAKPVPRIKKIANPHLEKSWSEIPHVTQHDEADITEMEKFRKSLRDLYTGEKLSITPLAFIIRAL